MEDYLGLYRMSKALSDLGHELIYGVIITIGLITLWLLLITDCCTVPKGYYKPNGLYSINHAIPASRKKSFIKWILDQPMTSVKHKKSEKESVKTKEPRQVLQDGRGIYHYETGTIKENKQVKPMPSVIKDLLLVAAKHAEREPKYFNQWIVNRYEIGQGILPHIDHKRFGNTIACITFIEPVHQKVDLIFRNPTNQTSFVHSTQDSSIYIMQDEARWDWTHEQLPIPDDLVAQPFKYRYSVTFRHIE